MWMMMKQEHGDRGGFGCGANAARMQREFSTEKGVRPCTRATTVGPGWYCEAARWNVHTLQFSQRTNMQRIYSYHPEIDKRQLQKHHTNISSWGLLYVQNMIQNILLYIYIYIYFIYMNYFSLFVVQ